MGVKWRPAAWEAHETPCLSAKFSIYDPFKTARLNRAGGKNKLCHSCGATATLATKNHKALYSFLRDQEVACSPKPPEVANSEGPVPVARPGPSRWPSRWPGPGGAVPSGRSRWPGPGGLVPVARSRSRSRFEGPRARGKKNLFCAQPKHSGHLSMRDGAGNAGGGAEGEAVKHALTLGATMHPC